MTRLYPSMAFTNIKSNGKTYIPYMISCILTISLFYIVCSLADNENLANLWGGDIIQTYMGMGQVIVSIFAFIFLFYINSFLVKRRRSEFGLYNILGMEKRHISKVITLETVYTYIIVMVIGILFGVLLDKFMFLILSKLFDSGVPLGFYISKSAMAKCFALFGAVFLLILLSSIRQIYKAKPVELLRSDNTGEREPKAKWLLAVIGVICLGSGYYIAVTTENPVAAFSMFFGAVILVIIGTYLVFTAGSIALLKLLRKNKGYYYKTKHFISVSSMMYRMKRNAVGLANICILSTMVLVMISTTLSMYLGSNESLRSRYPGEFNINSVYNDPMNDKVVNILDKVLRDEGLYKEDEISYRDLSVSAVYEEENNYFSTDTDKYGGLSAFEAYNSLSTLVFVPLDDYNRCMNAHETLESEDDVLIYSNRAQLNTDTIKVFDDSFHIVKRLNGFMKSGSLAANVSNGHFIVVKDISIIEKLFDENIKAYGEAAAYIQFQYMTNISGDEEANRDAIVRAYDQVRDEASKLTTGDMAGEAEDTGFSGSIECRSIEAQTFGLAFSGLFFIGVFLALLFIMATVLIMYYKQLTEGYEDKERFEIMQNVGMSHIEVKKAINSQILTVFFLPLITAGVHVGFAFPFIFRILTLMNLFNLKLFTMCTVGCFLVFALFYVIVYALTSKLYYKIVKK